MRRGVFVMLAAFALAGCTSYPSAWPTPRPVYRYRLGPRDAIRVTVWGRPELTALDMDVGPDGHIAIPLAGVIDVDGLTLEEASEKVATQLKEFVRDPIVTVELREIRSNMIHVVGEVRVPGDVPYSNGITFLEAIQRAGGYVAEFANVSHFLLVRNPLGDKQIFLYDMDDLLTNADGQQDVYLQPGDIVYVPPRYVTQYSRWIHQALAPLDMIMGSAYRGAYIMTLPRPF